MPLNFLFTKMVHWLFSKNEVRQWIQENAEDLLAQQENLE